MIKIDVREIRATPPAQNAKQSKYAQLILGNLPPYRADLKIPVLKTLSLFQRFLNFFSGSYKKIEAQMPDGTTQSLWLSSGSVEHCLDVSQIQQALKSVKESGKLQEAPKLISADELVFLSQQCKTEHELSEREARATLALASQELATGAGNRKVSHIGQASRNMLVLTGENGTKECYLLMTRTSKMGDRKLGEGGFKKAKYAIRLNPENEGDTRIFVVGTIRKQPVDKKPLTDRDLSAIRNEIKLLKEVRDLPNIVRLENSFEDDLKFYLLMEDCEGGDLSELFNSVRKRKIGELSFKQKMELAVDLAWGIEQLRSRGIFHRDIKPGNFLLTKEYRGKIGDLGFATLRSDSQALLQFCGTPAYLSPDFIRAHSDKLGRDRKVAAVEAADPWAFGLVLYKLFHAKHKELSFQLVSSMGGKKREKEKTLEQIKQIKQLALDKEIDKGLLKNSGVPLQIANIIKGLLQVDPENRWSITDAIESLENFNQTLAPIDEE